ncbi:MAG: alpha/beta hydrolase [Novosphingobium sp.]
MTTRHLVDPELLAGTELFADMDLGACSITDFRASIAVELPAIETYSRDDVRIERLSVPGPEGAGDVTLILYSPTAPSGPLPLFLNIHGGGYMFGSAEDNGPGDVRTASEVGCAVASVEYRLAPETPAPGAAEDCYAALAWLYRNADRLGLDRSRFSVGGQSAGGGLAAAVALLARDRGEIPLVFQMLIYPMLDDRTCTRPSEADNPHTGEFIWTRGSNAVGWRSHLGCEPGSPDISAYAAPARAESLAGLPPAYLSVGMLDLFLEEDVDYAKRLMAAGVPTELHVYPGTYHGYEWMVDAAVTQRSEAERRDALRSALRVKREEPAANA